MLKGLGAGGGGMPDFGGDDGDSDDGAEGGESDAPAVAEATEGGAAPSEPAAAKEIESID